ncbi:hypothetical protein, partial [Salmonella enterica]|nr:hypothetical protein [Salmonella enterica]MKD15281.1 hypothetical protein [Salmonella enterica]
SAVLPTELQRNRVGSYISGGKIFVKPHLTSYRFDCGLSHHFVAFADIFSAKSFAALRFLAHY